MSVLPGLPTQPQSGQRDVWRRLNREQHRVSSNISKGLNEAAVSVLRSAFLLSSLPLFHSVHFSYEKRCYFYLNPFCSSRRSSSLSRRICLSGSEDGVADGCTEDCGILQLPTDTTDPTQNVLQWILESKRQSRHKSHRLADVRMFKTSPFLSPTHFFRLIIISSVLQ